MSSKDNARTLGSLIQQAKKDAADKPRRVANSSQPELVFTTVSLTPAAKETLNRLRAYALENTQKTTSASAVVRALLAWAEKNDIGPELLNLIEIERNTGDVIWGKPRAD